MASSPKSQPGYAWLSAQVSEEFSRAIWKAAGAEGVTVSAFIRAACTMALKHPDVLAPYIPRRKLTVVIPPKKIGSRR